MIFSNAILHVLFKNKTSCCHRPIFLEILAVGWKKLSSGPNSAPDSSGADQAVHCRRLQGVSQAASSCFSCSKNNCSSLSAGYKGLPHTPSGPCVHCGTDVFLSSLKSQFSFWKWEQVSSHPGYKDVLGCSGEPMPYLSSSTSPLHHD